VSLFNIVPRLRGLSPTLPTLISAVAIASLTLVLPGCTVIAVVDTAASVAVKTVGLAADAAIGTARIAGRAVGSAVDSATTAKEKPVPTVP
jgi:NAD/NADP transhydrogenase alpha subunit